MVCEKWFRISSSKFWATSLVSVQDCGIYDSKYNKGYLHSAFSIFFFCLFVFFSTLLSGTSNYINSYRSENSRLQDQMVNSVQFSLVSQSCPALCDPTDFKLPGFSVHPQLPELTQTCIHWVGDTIQPSHPLLSPSPPAFNLSHYLVLFQWVSYSHQVAKGLQFHHQSFQWMLSTNFF